MNIKKIKRLPEYENVNCSVGGEYVEPYHEVVEETDPILDVIYAPDPTTGIPRSDLAITMSRDCSSEVAAYIRDKLQKEHVDNSTRFDSADDAIAMARKHGESIESYAERLMSQFKTKENENT